MKKIKIFSILVLLLIATTIEAQQTDMVVYGNNGSELFRRNIENIDSIKFEVSDGENYPIDVPFTEYSLEGTSCGWLYPIRYNMNLEGNIIIINNNEDLENYLCTDVMTDCISPCVDYHAIDFSEYTLLLVYGATNYGIYEFTKRIQQISQNEYIVNIDISLNACTWIEHWIEPLLITKLSENILVTLNKIEN